MSSPQPEPIDDIAGMRPAPPGREAPCDVQVRYGYGARDLMLPSHRMLSSDGATPRSHGRELILKTAADNGKQSTVCKAHSSRGDLPRERIEGFVRRFSSL